MAKPKSKPKVSTRGIALELIRLRGERKLGVRDLAALLGVSASTVSRMESGKRGISTEEVASVLTVLGVKGVEKERLIDQARRQNEPGLLENTTEQSRNFLNFEAKAKRITDFGLMLVPGLGQTVEYAHAVLSALRVADSEEDTEVWIGHRMRRQAILTRKKPPQLHWILTELSLRQPIGGAKVMAKQIRHLIHLVERPNITINLIPFKVVEHPGLLGQFLIMDFASDPTVVYVEDKTTGLFLDDPEKVAFYRLTVEKLMDLALDEAASVRLLKSIVSDLTQE